MSIFAAVALATKLIPIVASVVEEIELLDQTPGNGKHKLDAAIIIIKAVYDATNPEKPFEELSEAVVKIIAAVVGFYNSVGKFTKKTAS